LEGALARGAKPQRTIIRQSTFERTRPTTPIFRASLEVGATAIVASLRSVGAGKPAGTGSVLPLAGDVEAPASVGAPASAGIGVGVEGPASVEALAAALVLSGASASEPPDVSEGAAAEVSAAAPGVSVAFVVAAAVSVVAPGVSDGSIAVADVSCAAKVSVAAADASVTAEASVPPEVPVAAAGSGGVAEAPSLGVESEDNGAPSGAGGARSSAWAVATNAKAQRRAATKTDVQRRIRDDRRASQRGSWMLRTATELRSISALLTMACVRFQKFGLSYLTLGRS